MAGKHASRVEPDRFLDILRQFDARIDRARHGIPSWFEEPPAQVFEQCKRVLQDACRKERYPGTLTALQAATAVAWLCFAGSSDKKVIVIGQNEELGSDVLEKAAEIAVRFAEEFVRDVPAFADRVASGTVRDAFFEGRFTKHKITPRSGPSVLVWPKPRGRTALPPFSGILFAEGAVESPCILHEAFLLVPFSCA